MPVNDVNVLIILFGSTRRMHHMCNLLTLYGHVCMCLLVCLFASICFYTNRPRSLQRATKMVK